jgi:hypothetical protein
MPNESEEAFLVTYGLHSFVTHARPAGRSIFTISAQAGSTMARHAENLIADIYGRSAAIRVK